MLRSLFLKDYPYRDNYGDTDAADTVTLHLANSTWESDVLHIGIENQHESVTMNFTLEEVKELVAVMNTFIQSAEAERKEIV
jgi:hypothetical protein